ncbi:MAG: thioredoxin family protein, partial [Bacteroidetes bacterium]
MKKVTIIFTLTVLFGLHSAFISNQPKGYVVGATAIDFKLKNVDEKMVQLADYKKAKGFILIFTCNHCPFSQAYEDRIIALHKKYEPKGYPVVAINPNDASREPEDSYVNMKLRAKEKKFTFAYLYDESQQIAKTYGATRTPHVFVLQKNKAGNQVMYIGAIDDNYEDVKQVKEKYVEHAVDALLAGKTVNQTLTKAIGCGIKWKK